jgi:hypothetical protein
LITTISFAYENLLKLGETPYWKILLLVSIVKSLWKSYKEKPITSIKIKPHLNISIIYPLSIIFSTNTTKIISKGHSKIRSNFDLQSLLLPFGLGFFKNDFTFNLITHLHICTHS